MSKTNFFINRAKKIQPIALANEIRMKQLFAVFIFTGLAFIGNIHSQTLGQFTFTGANGCTSNTVTSQPAHATISPYTSTSVTCGSVTNAYGQSDWNTTPSINTSEYNEFTITPSTGYVLTLTNLTFTHYTSTFFGTANWTLRSSLDGYTSNLGTGSSNQVPASASTTFTANSAFTNSGAVTFRLYVTSANVNTTVWTNDNMTITGTTVACTPPSVPDTPYSNSPQCSPTGVTITKTNSAPGGVTWYWQDSNASGTSTSLNATSAYTATTTGTYYIRAQDNTGGCWSTSSGSVTVTVNPAPTITLGNTPTVCFGTTTTTLSYSGTSNSPDKYSITYDATALAAGFTNVSNASLPSSPITLSLTATAAGTYNYTVTVKNNSTGCVSSGTAKTITLNSPATVTPGGPDQAAQSATPSAITLAGASVGGEATTGAWSITSGGGTLSSISQTGSPQSVTYTPAASYSGTAVLTLTTNSFICSSTSGNRIISIDPATSQSYVTAGAYTFTVPACVNSAIVECWGAGGGGGGNGQNEDGGGGGGGGAYSKSTFTLTPGSTYTVNVGAGGNFGILATDGGNGGDTWFINSTSILAKGGGKGLKQTGSGGTGGAGGAGGLASSGIGSTKYSGGSGASGNNNSAGVGGGGGSSAGNSSDGNNAPAVSGSTGAGGTAPTGGGAGGGDSYFAVGTAGSSPGGGGGGGSVFFSGGTGGAGAAGKVVISWINTLAISSNTITAATACVSTTNTPIHSFSVAGNNACITDVSFVTTGNYTAAEISNFKLYYTTTNTFSTSNLLATIASPTVAGTQTFPTFSVAFSNTTRYLWITMDVASSVTDGHTIAVSATGPSNITSATTATGSGSASGTQTLKANASISLTSAGGSNNQSKCINTALTTITYTVGGGATGATITGLPTGVTGTYSTGTVTISGTPTVTGTSNYTITTTGICTQTATTGTITVNALPTIMTSNATICAGQTATLTATGGTSYSWNTGGTTATINPSPTTNTSYTVTVINANGCSASAVASVTVNTLPTVSSTVSPSSTVCVGTSVTLNGTGAASYSWTGGITNNVAFVPTTTTTYTVTGTDGNGCSNTSVKTITIDLVTLAISGNKTICYGAATTFTASGASSYLWSTGATTTTVTLTPSTTTTYSISGTDGLSCSGSTTFTVVVDAPLYANAGHDTIVSSATGTVTIGGTPTASSGTSPYSYSWSPSDFLNSTTVANPVASPTVAMDYIVQVTDNLGCTKKDTVTAFVPFNLITNAGTNKTICYGSSVGLGGNPSVFGGVPPYTYNWRPAGLIDSTVANPFTKNLNSSATFTLQVIDNDGAIGTSTITVIVLPALTVNAGTAQTVCAGISVDLGGGSAVSGGTSPYTYKWFAGSDTVSNDTISDPTAQPLISSAYLLTVVDGNDCSGSNSVAITVKSKPIIFAGNDSTIVLGDSMILGGYPTAQGIAPYTYNWTPSTSLNKDTIANPIATPNATRSYVLTVEDVSGCSYQSKDTVKITVDSVPSVVAGANQMICLHDTAILGGNPTVKGGKAPFTYSWSPSTGLNSTTFANPKASPSSSTVYALTVTDNNGFVQYDTVSITVNSLPVAHAGSDTTVNIPGITLGTFISDTISSSASGGTYPYIYSWQPAGNMMQNDVANPFSTLTDTVTFYLVVADSNNCRATDSIRVNFDNIYCSSCTLDSCTWTINNSNATNYTINNGQKLCIRSGGTVTGNIILNTGGKICNAGKLTPSSFTFNGGTLINTANALTQITGNLNIYDSTQLINDGGLTITGNMLTDAGSTVSNVGIFETGGKIEVITKQFQNSGIIILNSGNFLIADSGVVNNTGSLKGIDSLKNHGVLKMGAKGYVFATNLFNYSSGSIKRSYDSVPFSTDSTFLLLPDSITKGSIMICSQTENRGLIKENIDICDYSPPSSGPVYLDVNTGTIDTTVTYCTRSAIPIDSIEVCGGCPTLAIRTNTCGEDMLRCTASSSRKFDNYEFILNSHTIQIGSDTLLSLHAAVFTGDTLVVIGTSANTPCKTVTSAPYIIKQRSTIIISGDSVAVADSAILVASGGVSYRWTTTDDTLISSSSNVIVYPVQSTVYLLTAIDTNQCISTIKFEVIKHLQVTHAVTNPTEASPYSGEIRLEVTGGRLPLTYSWNNGAEKQYLNFIGAGTYNVTITDANGEVVEQTITLSY